MFSFSGLTRNNTVTSIFVLPMSGFNKQNVHLIKDTSNEGHEHGLTLCLLEGPETFEAVRNVLLVPQFAVALSRK